MYCVICFNIGSLFNYRYDLKAARLEKLQIWEIWQTSLTYLLDHCLTMLPFSHAGDLELGVKYIWALQMARECQSYARICYLAAPCAIGRLSCCKRERGTWSSTVGIEVMLTDVMTSVSRESEDSPLVQLGGHCSARASATHDGASHYQTGVTTFVTVVLIPCQCCQCPLLAPTAPIAVSQQTSLCTSPSSGCFVT